ncbi:MAG: flavin reductase family protein [Phycisphaeraceae bacterium]|nr:flavin reductase family protein [Phycisphaeraceae bacterium]
MEIDPATLPSSERYKLLIGAIVPRPIAVVGTTSPDGASVNLAPFSFFAGAGSEPMSLLFCPANDEHGHEKDSLRNAKSRSEGGSGEFTVSIAAHPIIRRVVAAAEPLPYGASEFELSGLTPRPGVMVRAPFVAESPVAFECRTLQVIRLDGGSAVPNAGNIVIGAVVRVHVRDEMVDARHRIDPAKLDAVGRMGGFGYATTRDRFELPWGAAALEMPPGS